jgi:hypothetical protein
VPRARLFCLAAAVLCTAACGGGGGKKTAGEEVALVQGTSDYAVGPVRATFLVIDRQSRLIEKPRAAVTVTDSDGTTVATTTAALEPIGIPGVSEAATGDAHSIYVARFRIAKPGRYTLAAQPDGASIHGVGTLDVAQHPRAPAVGDRAIPSRTPTIASTHGNLAELTTAEPPDRSLLRYSVADSVKAHVPFVLVFATPKFCQSRTCGPTVDVAKAVQKRVPGGRFIHVEIYKDNNPAQGENRWVGEWHLPSEPLVFVVGRDGRIKSRFEGSVSVAELERGARAAFRSP